MESMWGAQTFLHSIVRRIQTRQVGDSNDLRGAVSARALTSGRFPASWNILLLGAPGCGKSSLIYTFWRSLTDAVVTRASEEGVPPAKPVVAVSHSVEKLCMDWNFMEYNCEDNFELVMEGAEEPTVLMGPGDNPRTTGVSLVSVQPVAPEHSGILMIDTPGIAASGEEEAHRIFLHSCVVGTAAEGSGLDAVTSQEATGLYYWAPRLSVLDPLGVFTATPVSTAAHVVALVIDMSLPSFQDMLDVDLQADNDWAEAVPQLQTYHNMIDAAIEQRLEVFVILTHLDSYHKNFENIIVNTEQKASVDMVVQQQNGQLTPLAPLSEQADEGDPVEAEGGGRLGEDMLGELKGIYLQLSQSLSFGGRDVPPDRMFVVENYRNAKRRTESRLALAAVEGLEAMLDAADNAIQVRYNEEVASCSVS